MCKKIYIHLVPGKWPSLADDEVNMWFFLSMVLITELNPFWMTEQTIIGQCLEAH